VTTIEARVAEVAGAPVRGVRPVGAQHRWRMYDAELASGERVFVKAADAPLGELFRTEAAGLRWLGAAVEGLVPEVLGADDTMLVLARIEEGRADAAAAERFGRDLAAMHAAGADAFGAPWPGFIAELPLDNTPGDDWPSWYAERRLAPYVRTAVDAGGLSAADAAPIERVMARIADLAGPAIRPARIHGDCWSGNVLWSGGRGRLVDPAAHGGHPETDLAMLDLFGAPHLARIVAAYEEVRPLPGRAARVPLHQLHPLLVHVCLYGGGYRTAAVDAARAALRG
jgi:fructosamine-3-kinase